MPDCVLDTTVVVLSNEKIGRRAAGTAFDRAIGILEDVIEARRRLRYNSHLLGEYMQQVQAHRNDVIAVLFTILDSGGAVLVARNKLSRQDYARALECGWPSHDQHLLAAAIDGDSTTLFITEAIQAACERGVRRHFGIRIVRVV